jgi:thiol:disulfide interchange protein DsbD
MKKMQLISASLLLTLTTLAQDRVHLDYKIEKKDAKTFTLHITANMAQGWHIYSQEQPPKAISQPTKILFANNPSIALEDKGKPKEAGNRETYEDKSADVVQYQYQGTVEFTQTLTLKARGKTKVEGSITYQACTEDQCERPRTVPFSIDIE